MKKRIFFAAFVLIVSSLAAQRSALVLVDTLSMQVDTLVFHFTTYTPATDAGFAFMTTKPDTLNSNIGLCVVAAFTSKAPEHIVGTSVCIIPPRARAVTASSLLRELKSTLWIPMTALQSPKR